jgi:hypothetical protein
MTDAALLLAHLGTLELPLSILAWLAVVSAVFTMIDAILG